MHPALASREVREGEEWSILAGRASEERAEAALAEFPEEAADTQRPVPCSVCGVNLRRGATFAACVGCEIRAHKKCTGRRRGQDDWRCGDCAATRGDGMRAPVMRRRRVPQRDETNKHLGQETRGAQPAKGT